MKDKKDLNIVNYIANTFKVNARNQIKLWPFTIQDEVSRVKYFVLKR